MQNLLLAKRIFLIIIYYLLRCEDVRRIRLNKAKSMKILYIKKRQGSFNKVD